MTKLLPPEEYYASLPRKRGSAGALIIKDGKILALETTYKKGWEIPGGVVEDNESYLDAAKRECREELGTDVHIERLLCIDYQSAQAPKTEGMHFVFLGSVNANDITIDENEIKALHWQDLNEAKKHMAEPVYMRVEIALKAYAEDRFFYLENGQPVL